MKKIIGYFALSLVSLCLFFSHSLISTLDDYFPITNVQVEAPFVYVSKLNIESTLSDHINKGLVSVDTALITKALNALPWVRQATVKKMWPGTLFIKIKERKAIAQFNDTFLIDELGESFSSETDSTINLVKLHGSQGSEKELLQEYKKLSRLLNNVALVIESLEITPSTLTIVMNDGLKLLMTKKETEEQMARFIHVYPELKQKKTTHLLRVDMRYKHGLAVKW